MKFNWIANMTPPTGDPNILGYVSVAKDNERRKEPRTEGLKPP
jgi:hypothetical protein